MGEIIDKITIKGFKSIRDLESFKLGNTNVLIGPNGAGKSNFVSLFRLLRELMDGRLQLALATEGGADACLYLGPKVTKELRVKLMFGQNGYEFSLVPTVDNKLVFSSEASIYNGPYVQWKESKAQFGSGHFEARLKDRKDDAGLYTRKGPSLYVFEALSSWVVYHFHDTSLLAGVRRQGGINDNVSLRSNAENLAAFLYRLQRTDTENYTKIRDVVKLAAPFFDDFQLRPVPTNPEMIQLEWRQRGSDYPLRASQLSDGTLRFICLATALLQPSPPRTMLFDEPELGLHPYALSLLGGMIQKSIAPWGNPVNQIIISTQSAPLLNEFTPEDIIVVDRFEDQSVFRKLEPKQLSGWLADYSLGELWQKNLLGGRPQVDAAHPVPTSGETC
ncbi:AAA family ATPase [Alloacidobacterium sp.]|uniref:AAA family ATPase n=1 Tax=Alloacidobacterium sp. TaxID=2951999 RepID=UPI002D427E21|nr:AAA family ATPase [Alloacidobacterium sp.]HYK37035.1 AAA family ATPase [Alloacidobacterium sp.]